ncbi:hypothetical protein ACQEVF_25110 [Nonomuraea polychroma]|uniref:hypothetical protein n=1 Tax=Nonomuraea polychroma TaxID=46176 RepID=UPI003D8F182E
MSPEAPFAIAILIACLVAIHLLLRRAERLHRPPVPRLRAPDINLLEKPVMLPARCSGEPYIERWSPDVDGVDVELAEVHDVLWPREEWLFVLHCPTPVLSGYATPGEAHKHEPGGQSYDCACGLVHVRRSARSRRPRRRRRRTSRTGST